MVHGLVTTLDRAAVRYRLAYMRNVQKKKAKKAKILSPAKLKKELDRLFSIYIRTHFAINGRLYCFTCDKPMEFSSAHCGHFIPRNILITRWSVDNCRPQCVGCNIFGNGKILDFEERLKKQLGAAKVEKMKAQRHQIFKVDSAWYVKRIAELKELLPNR